MTAPWQGSWVETLSLRISSCGRFWPSGGPSQGSDQGDSWLSYRNSKTKETCPLYWPLDETRTEGSKEKIQWRLKQLCRLGGKWERKRQWQQTNQQWAVGVRLLALLFPSLFCPCHTVHCLPLLCSWCLDRDKQIKPTHGFLEELPQLRKQDLHPPKGEKAGFWAQSRNRFCCWLSRIL